VTIPPKLFRQQRVQATQLSTTRLMLIRERPSRRRAADASIPNWCADPQEHQRLM